jgi:integrase
MVLGLVGVDLAGPPSSTPGRHPVGGMSSSTASNMVESLALAALTTTDSGNTGHATVQQCRSLLLRIYQYAVDESAIDTNPVRKVSVPKRRADPEKVLSQARRRALTPQEAGQLLARFPLFWLDHVLTLLGTGLRFGELAGLRRRNFRRTYHGAVAKLADPATQMRPTAARVLRALRTACRPSARG